MNMTIVSVQLLIMSRIHVSRPLRGRQTCTPYSPCWGLIVKDEYKCAPEHGMEQGELINQLDSSV